LIAIISGIVIFAGTLASTDFTNIISGAVDITITGLAFRVSVISETALVAKR
jgi:hypothetical protein